MPRTRFDEDDFDDSPGDDRDAPLESDLDAEDDDAAADTRPCPNCRREVYEEADQCPHCGTYISSALPQGRGYGWVFIVTVALLIVLSWLWLAGSGLD